MEGGVVLGESVVCQILWPGAYYIWVGACLVRAESNLKNPMEKVYLYCILGRGHIIVEGLSPTTPLMDSPWYLYCIQYNQQVKGIVADDTYTYA